jgi:hypothetical protein
MRERVSNQVKPAFLQQMVITHLTEKCSFYETWMLITIVTKDLQWILFWGNSVLLHTFTAYLSN